MWFDLRPLVSASGCNPALGYTLHSSQVTVKAVFHLIKPYGVSNTKHHSAHKSLQGLARTPFCPALIFQALPPPLYAHLVFRRARPGDQRARETVLKEQVRAPINQRFGNQEIRSVLLWEKHKPHVAAEAMQLN